MLPLENSISTRIQYCQGGLLTTTEVVNMSDEQGAYALTVNLALDIFYHRAHGGYPY